jgi:hypothetical protein
LIKAKHQKVKLFLKSLVPNSQPYWSPPNSCLTVPFS